MGLLISASNLTTDYQFGLVTYSIFNSSCTTQGAAHYCRVRTAAAAFTMTTGIGFSVDIPSIGAGSAITNLYGVKVENQSGATNNYAIYTGTGLVRFGDAVSSTNSIKSSSATAGIGYATGAGGTVTQATSKATGVTLSNVTGQITMNNAALAASTTVSFTLTNSAIAATDILCFNHVSGGTVGAYVFGAQCAAGSAVINVRNVSLGSLSEAIVIGFVLIKGATA